MLARSSVQALGVRGTPHILFLHLGRSGPGRFLLELAGSLAGMRHARTTFCVPRDNEIFGQLADLGCDVLPADIGQAPGGTCGSGPAYGEPAARLYHNVAGELARQRSTGMVSLMPCTWSCTERSTWPSTRPSPRPRIRPHAPPNSCTRMLARLARDHGIRHLTLINDAQIYLREPTQLAPDGELGQEQRADPVVTLSALTADRLASSGAVTRDRLVTLFHPDLSLGADQPPIQPAGTTPFRVLVLAPLLAPVLAQPVAVLVEAIALLRTQGVPVTLGVFGAGPLGPLRTRLKEIGAEVVTDAPADHALPALLARHHAVALLPDACGQSMVAAVALGAGLPLIGWRAGWLTEQVRDGATGVVAEAAEPTYVAAAIRRLATDAGLYAGIRATIRRSAWERSMRRFAEHLVALAIDAPPLPEGLPRRELTWV